MIKPVPASPAQREDAIQAHTNLNIFAAVIAIMEGGCIYGVGTAQGTAQKIIKLCTEEQRKQLKIYDRGRS